MRAKPIIRSIGLMAATAALASPLSQARAGEALQDLDQLDILVAAAMGAEIGEPGGARAPIDRRLKLEACPETPQIAGPDLNAAAVRCNALGWRIRVPLNLTESAKAANAQGRNRVAGEAAVKRGEPILLTVERPSFTLSRVMVADKDGRVGEVIPVRDTPRGTPIFVRITEPGMATILGQ